MVECLKRGHASEPLTVFGDVVSLNDDDDVAFLGGPLLDFTMPDTPGIIHTVFSIPTSIAEFGLLLYLIIFGVRTSQDATRSPGAVQG